MPSCLTKIVSNADAFFAQALREGYSSAEAKSQIVPTKSTEKK